MDTYRLNIIRWIASKSSTNPSLWEKRDRIILFVPKIQSLILRMIT